MGIAFIIELVTNATVNVELELQDSGAYGRAFDRALYASVARAVASEVAPDMRLLRSIARSCNHAIGRTIG